jgi:hypothetical protein
VSQHLDLIVTTIEDETLLGFIGRVNCGPDSALLPSLDLVRGIQNWVEIGGSWVRFVLNQMLEF